jgi:hypothetical protein
MEHHCSVSLHGCYEAIGEFPATSNAGRRVERAHFDPATLAVVIEAQERALREGKPRR